MRRRSSLLQMPLALTVLAIGLVAGAGGARVADAGGSAQVKAVRSASVSSLAAVGDVNGDCIVNGLDLNLIARRFLTAVGSLLYSPAYDLNHDGVINILDIQIVAAHFGQHC